MSKSKSKGSAGFGKFIQQKESGAQKKERIRQEKKAVRKETQAYFDQKKAEARAQREQYRAQQAGNDTRGRKGTTGKRAGEDNGDWESGRAAGTGRTPGKRPVNKGYNRMSYMERKKKQAEKRANTDLNEPTTQTSFTNKRKQATSKGYSAENRPAASRSYEAKGKARTSYDRTAGDKKPFSKSTGDKAPYSKAPVAKAGGSKGSYNEQPRTAGKSTTPAFSKSSPATTGKVLSKGAVAETAKFAGKSTAASSTQAGGKSKGAGELIPLNKFLAHSGISSRRDSADIVKSGLVVVNGKVITEPGFKVSEKDEIKVNGKPIAIRRTMVYILINKPKDYITTTDDPQGRKTVLDLIRNATTERVYPVGRLDRNTTGVLLLTNDGDLAQKLAHPSYEVKKIYEVKLDKPLVKKDFDAILAGIELEDGFIAPDVLAYADPKDKSVIGIEIHSGRNRIVRRIFEHMGYDVRNLDRVMYANLTKKNVERGKWRFLNEKEVRLLKYLNASYTKNKIPSRG